jgi:uncharacterized protein (TIGR02266 family)
VTIADAHRVWAVRDTRLPVTLVVRYRAEGMSDFTVERTEDISTGGIFVCCDEPHTAGTAVHLEIALPGGTAAIEALGRVVRVGQGPSGRDGMAIMFTSVDGSSRALLHRFVVAGLAARR